MQYVGKGLSDAFNLSSKGKATVEKRKEKKREDPLPRGGIEVCSADPARHAAECRLRQVSKLTIFQTL